MAKWKVKDEWGSGTSPGRDTDFAYAFKLASGGEEMQTTIEFVGGGNGSEAREILNPYLKRERPPRRLIVSRERHVSEAEE